MTSQPKVSVVVTVLNEATTITELLESLVAQTFAPDEVIIVDGGSSDQTVSLIKKFQNRYSDRQIKFLVKPGNRSVGRNAGLEKASHSLIALTDAGCIPHLDWLEQLVKAYGLAASRLVTSPTAIAGYYDARVTTPFQEAVVPYALVMPDRVNPTTFLPATRSMLLSKQAWLAAGKFDERLSDNEDYAFAHHLKKEAQIVFAGQAKVSWQPRSTPSEFLTMIIRFARGDIEAGLIRHKLR